MARAVAMRVVALKVDSTAGPYSTAGECVVSLAVGLPRSTTCCAFSPIKDSTVHRARSSRRRRR
jgi:hypothetical protein